MQMPCRHHRGDYAHEIETEREIKTFTIVSRALGRHLPVDRRAPPMCQGARRAHPAFIELIDAEAAANLPEPTRTTPVCRT